MVVGRLQGVCVCTGPILASGSREAGGTSGAFGTAHQCRDTGLSQAPRARRGSVTRRVSEPDI